MQPQSQWGKRRLQFLQRKHDEDIAEADRLLQETKDILDRGTTA